MQDTNTATSTSTTGTTSPTPPTCQELIDAEPILIEDKSGWRHGVDRYEVYRRDDGTFWSVRYRISTDGETHGLRDGEARIAQVEPYQETVTKYRAISV